MRTNIEGHEPHRREVSQDENGDDDNCDGSGNNDDCEME